MPAIVVMLALLLWPLSVGAQDRTCEDRLRETLILADHHQRGRARDAAEAARTIADLVREVERLRAENQTLKQNLPAGQTPGG